MKKLLFNTFMKSLTSFANHKCYNSVDDDWDDDDEDYSDYDQEETETFGGWAEDIDRQDEDPDY